MSNGLRPESVSHLPEITPLDFRRKILQSLITHNPLYLVSACFVLHGTSLLLPKALSSVEPYNPWPLLGLSCGYILVLALTGIAIVRWGKVWDDARSILLIVVGLLIELSLALDSPLAQNFSVGRMLVLLGLAFAVGVSEGLLWGLPLRLPVLFRIPFYCMLALVFLYPLLLVRTPSHQNVLDISWGIYLFSTVAAIVILTLLPAVRRGDQYVRDNGSPWSWPWFPWTLFGMLGVGICLRGYVLSLSFDPVISLGLAEAMQLKTAYGTYFLVPIFMSIAVLLLELGIVSAVERVQRIALGIPLACIILSFPAGEPTAPYLEFLDKFMNRFGSPVWMVAIAALLFHCIAMVRRVRLAEAALVVTLVAASMVGPGTVNIVTLTAPQPIILWLLWGFQVWRGMQKRDSRRALVGAIAGILAMRWGPWGDWSGFPREFWCIHAGIVAVLVLGMVFRDGFARWLRRVGALLLLLAILAALVASIELQASLEKWWMPVYVGSLIVVSLVWAYVCRDFFYLCSGLTSAACVVLALTWQVYLQLRETTEWRGVRSFLMGFLLLGLASAISAMKAGMVRKLKPLFSRIYGRLLG